jgi:hypothetical protein
LIWLHQLTSLIQLIAREVMSGMAFMPAAARPKIDWRPNIYLGSGMIKDCKIPNICATIQE